MKTQKKSSKNAVTAGVLIALYFVTYLVIGAISIACPCFIFTNAYACSTTCCTNLSYASCKNKVSHRYCNRSYLTKYFISCNWSYSNCTISGSACRNNCYVNSKRWKLYRL